MGSVQCVSIVWLIGLITVSSSLAEAPTGSIDPTSTVMKQTCEWFDTLGYPTFRDQQFVSVELESWLEPRNEPTGPPKIHGFLVNGHVRGWVVQMLEGEFATSRSTARSWKSRLSDC